MNIFLYIAILAGIGCLIYSLIVYRQRRYVLDHEESSLSIYENGTHIEVRYKKAVFTGQCLYDITGEELERHITVRTIKLKLITSEASLLHWTKDDLYEIERQLDIHYPEATVEWEEPMQKLLPNFNEDPYP